MDCCKMLVTKAHLDCRAEIKIFPRNDNLG